MDDLSCDVAIIGAGTAGLAAERAARDPNRDESAEAGDESEPGDVAENRTIDADKSLGGAEVSQHARVGHGPRSGTFPVAECFGQTRTRGANSPVSAP